VELRRLAAALAALSLVLGGAAAVAPATAAPVASETFAAPVRHDLAPAPPFSISMLESAQFAQPGRLFDFAPWISLQGGVDVAEGSQIALVITFPEGFRVETSDCEAFISADDTLYTLEDQYVESGDECLVDADIATMTAVLAEIGLYRQYEPLEPTVPPPAEIAFAIERTVVVNDDGESVVGTDLAVPTPPFVGTAVSQALYLAAVSGYGMTWPEEDFAEINYTLSVPDLTPDGDAGSLLNWASTTWILRGPDFATLIDDATESDSSECENVLADDGYCQITIVQDSSCDDSHCESDGDSAGTPGPPPGFCSSGYCWYSFSLHYSLPVELQGHAMSGEFVIDAVASSYVEETEIQDPMPAGWLEGSAAAHTFVAQAVETSVTLSAPSRPIGGGDITATIRARLFEDVDVRAAYGDEFAFLEVHLRVELPSFLHPAADPMGCDEWFAVSRVCVLQFGASPPGPAREISLDLAVPASRPPYDLSGMVRVEATHVEVFATNEGVYGIEDVPTSVVIPSEAPFEVYEPILGTSVVLSAAAGSPGGDDVVATFRVSRLEDSVYDFLAGSVEVRVTWPDFLTPVGVPPGCAGFVTEPTGNDATCTMSGLEPEDYSASFDLAFSMPADSTDAPQTGDFTIEGVLFTATTSGEPDVNIETFDERYILPATAPFVVDSEVFSVDVTLDRSVSTPGGVRLYASILVTYGHEMSDIRYRPSVGITLGWPGFLTVTSPPGIVGCDELVGNVCHLEQMWEEGDAQRVEIWFDMPESGSAVGEISALAHSLCTGRRDYSCPPLPVGWVGSDAEQFTVLEPSIGVDLVVDRDTGWTGGKPITANATITHEGTIPGTLPGLTVDLVLDWPESFLTPTSIGGCDQLLAGGVCRLTGLDAVKSEAELKVMFGMPPVEDLRVQPPDPPPVSMYPKTGQIEVSGVNWSYIAPAPTPLPCDDPTPGSTPSPSPTATPNPSSSATPSPSPTCAPEPESASAPTASSSPSSRPTLDVETSTARIASAGQSVTDLNALTPEDLVDALVGQGVTTSNAVYTGNPDGAGVFSGFEEDVVGFASGLVLSTGEVVTVPGPNESESESGWLEEYGDADLDALLGSETIDASVLTFEFVPSTSQLVMEFVFASEAYSEYSEHDFHDVVGIFVNEINCALTPGEDPVPVSVATINGGSPLGIDPQRPELYRDNTPLLGGGDPPIPPSSPIDIEADGLTKVLQCISPVVANQTNTMKLAIADAQDEESQDEESEDYQWDSQVFIRSGSVRVNHSPVAAEIALTTDEDTPVGLTLSATDADGDSLTFEIVTPPSHGTLSGSGASLSYTPAPGFIGTDSFTYQADDSMAASNAATVSIAVEPEDTDPPPPPPPVDPAEVELPLEWIGSDFVNVAVIQPKVTVTPLVARPGQVVTAYIENLPEGASITAAWDEPEATTPPAIAPPPAAVAVLQLDVTFKIQSILLMRRTAVGERWLAVSSADGSFGTFFPSRPLLVVPRSTVADELVGRGG
jgi:hypothetical protein